MGIKLDRISPKDCQADLCTSWSFLAVSVSKDSDTTVGPIYSFHRLLTAKRIRLAKGFILISLQGHCMM